MSDADPEEPDSRPHDARTGIRYRKSVAFSSSRMVGSGSGTSEYIGKDVVAEAATMELEMDTGDEDSGADDTSRLIPSTLPRVSVEGINNNAPKKMGKRGGEIGTEDDENVWTISVQMFIPFLLAGFGMVAASLLLDLVQHWPVYQVVSEVYILVPALLGLKGNLEMTLASRLSTQANLGHMDTPNQQWTLIIGNLALIQCQAMVVGLLASLAAVILGWVPEAHFDVHHGLLLCASALVTASVASFLLGLIMVAVILLSRRMNINPDNVATPIAASLGDLTTLALLSWIASLLYSSIEGRPWIAPTLIAFCVLATPIWGYIAARNPFTKEVLDYGWSPVISAMLISSIGGLILDYTISSYKGIAVFQLVINGVGGNLAAVQASRISTSLHKEQSGSEPHEPLTVCVSPFHAFLAPGGHARTARVLLMMVIPGHLIFSYTISYLQAGHTSFTATFIVVYLFAALLQVNIILFFKLTVNIDKTKILIFKKGGRVKRGQKWKYKGRELDRVSEYKYLGVWFSTGNTFGKHIKLVTGKIRKAMNGSWGIFKRARIGSLRRRLHLMDAIVKSGMLYGVEIWGWKQREQIERMQARYVKMAMGLRRNTPGYIWRMEAGRRGIGVELWERAAKYLGEIMGMDGARWPKICLKEEVRGIINGNPSKWGRELKLAMEGIGEGEIWETIRSGDKEELDRKIERGIKIRRDQEIQQDWNKIDVSKYCKEYQSRKRGFEMEEYWEDRGLRGEMKEVWARMRCGSVGREKNKGFRDTKCRVCEAEEETLAHICECSGVRRKVDRKVREELEEWVGSDGERMEIKINNALRAEKPVVALCEYVAQFERVAGRISEE